MNKGEGTMGKSVGISKDQNKRKQVQRQDQRQETVEIYWRSHYLNHFSTLRQGLHYSNGFELQVYSSSVSKDREKFTPNVDCHQSEPIKMKDWEKPLYFLGSLFGNQEDTVKADQRTLDNWSA